MSVRSPVLFLSTSQNILCLEVNYTLSEVAVQLQTMLVERSRPEWISNGSEAERV